MPVVPEDRPAPVTLEQLSLYTAPEQNQNRPEPAPGPAEETVGAVRRSMEPFLTWCGGTYSKVRPRVQRGVQLGADAWAFLRDPPQDFYPKAGVIGVTGVLGLFVARGSRVQKLLYPAGLMALSTSMYYPEKAARVVTATGDRAYAGAVQSYAAVEKLFRKQETNKQPDHKP